MKREENYYDKSRYEKQLYIECLRILAIVLVILNHCDLYYTFYSNTDSSITFAASLLISVVCKMNIPLFMMITGAVLVAKEDSWHSILKNRVVRMLIVLLISSAVMYGLQCFAWHQNTFSVSEFIRKLLTNDIQASYWYQYKYIEILLLLPFTGAVARRMNEDLLKYILSLAVIFKVILPVVHMVTNYSIPMGFYVLDDSVLYVVLGYYLGNRIERDKLEKYSFKKIGIAAMTCIVLACVLVLLQKKLTGEYSESVLSIMTPVMTVLAFIGIQKYFASKSIGARTKQMLLTIGSCTFGVYLVEHIGQKLFKRFYLWMCERTFGVIACGIYALCILMFGFALTYVLKKIKIVRKYM